MSGNDDQELSAPVVGRMQHSVLEHMVISDSFVKSIRTKQSNSLSNTSGLVWAFSGSSEVFSTTAIVIRFFGQLTL